MPKDCEKGKVRNPETGRCVKIGGAVYERIKHLLKKTSSSSRRKRRSKSPKRKDCEEGKVLNPETGRCIKIGGAVYNRVFGSKKKVKKKMKRKVAERRYGDESDSESDSGDDIEDEIYYGRKKMKRKVAKRRHEEKSDENEEWWDKEDEFFYGKIPRDVTEDELVKIMVKGLRMYVDYKMRSTRKLVSRDELKSVLGSWFEHDSLRDDKFDHLIPEEEYDHFVRKVINIVWSEIYGKK